MSNSFTQNPFENEDLFPAIRRPAWLNHAAIGPWPKPVIEAMRGYVQHNALNGPVEYQRWLDIEQQLRTQLSQLLNAESPDDIALVKNTSDGLNLIANGLTWQPGDVVVCCAKDFPSNVLPWTSLSRLGVEVRQVDLHDPQGLPLPDPEQALIDVIDERVRLVAVSAVRYDSGMRLDIDRIGHACRHHGSVFVVDAIQQLGALPIDVKQSPIDFLVAGSHKWLMAPEGLAVFWSSAGARAGLRPAQVGWRMWHDPFNFERTSWQAPDTARRFEPGTLNMAGIHGLQAAVQLLLEISVERSSRQLLDNCAYLQQALRRMDGIQLVTPAERQRHAGIASFRHSKIPSSRLFSVFTEAGMQCAQRGQWLRLSPNFYTPKKQLDQAIEVVASAIHQ